MRLSRVGRVGVSQTILTRRVCGWTSSCFSCLASFPPSLLDGTAASTGLCVKKTAPSLLVVFAPMTY